MFNIQPGQGLGFAGSKQIALGLGAPYEIDIEIPEPPSGGTSKKINRPYFWYKEKGRKHKDPELARMARIMAEDDEILEFIKVVLTKGLL